MSTKIKVGLLTVMAVVLGAVLFVVVFAQRGAEEVPVAEEFHFDAAKLKDSTVWTQVNPEPYFVSSRVNALCAPAAVDYEAERKTNPHASTFITVYVNNIARGSIFAKQLTQFPEGSIIVKAKVGTRFEGGKPLLYTIMRKREHGYNPKVGDWEFSVVGPNGTQVVETGKLENCQTCHVGQGSSDFVFRSYVKFE